MSPKEVAKHILSNSPTLRFFDSYMFGSYINGIGHDIDILVIGPSDHRLRQLKSELSAIALELPLDVLYMEPIEAEETSFVESAACIQLACLASETSKGFDTEFNLSRSPKVL